MELNTLKPATGATKGEKRVGRGQGSGHGKTACRGMNGAKSRSGYSRKLGFEGGQMPIQRRLPKYGFNNPNRVEYKAINLSNLQTLSEKAGLNVITVDTLIEHGLINKKDMVKVLGNGELTVKLDVTAHAFSKSAIAKIEALQGTTSIL